MRSLCRRIRTWGTKREKRGRAKALVLPRFPLSHLVYLFIYLFIFFARLEQAKSRATGVARKAKAIRRGGVWWRGAKKVTSLLATSPLDMLEDLHKFINESFLGKATLQISALNHSTIYNSFRPLGPWDFQPRWWHLDDNTWNTSPKGPKSLFKYGDKRSSACDCTQEEKINSEGFTQNSCYGNQPDPLKANLRTFAPIATAHL